HCSASPATTCSAFTDRAQAGPSSSCVACTNRRRSAMSAHGAAPPATGHRSRSRRRCALVKLQLLTLTDLAAIDPLIASYAFKPYRHYRVLSRKQQNAVLREEISE